jgi:NADP-dependent 3-hydroxy acid dehydrogenase YdfG
MSIERALVIGASSGVGRATAAALARAGADVLAVARRAELLQGLAREHPSLRTAALDLTDGDAVARTARELERLDVLVYAAGLNVPRRRLAELAREDWRAVLDTNATAAFLLIQACLPALRASQGLVIVLASVSGRWPDASGSAYQASKRAVLGLAHAVALEEREHGLRVSALLPGVIDTPLLDARPEPPPSEVRAHALRAEDVAEICVFLARLPPRLFVPELVVLPTALQRLGGA